MVWKAFFKNRGRGTRLSGRSNGPGPWMRAILLQTSGPTLLGQSPFHLIALLLSLFCISFFPSFSLPSPFSLSLSFILTFKNPFVFDFLYNLFLFSILHRHELQLFPFTVLVLYFLSLVKRLRSTVTYIANL